MDEDQALAAGVMVVFTLTGLCCLAWGLHNTFIAERIPLIAEPSGGQYASLLTPASTASSRRESFSL